MESSIPPRTTSEGRTSEGRASEGRTSEGRSSERRARVLDALPSLVAAADADELCRALATALTCASDAIGVAVSLDLASGAARASVGSLEGDDDERVSYLVAIRDGKQVYGRAGILVPGGFGEDVAGDIAAVAALAAAAATRLGQLFAARTEARFDWLTGIGNRRAFEAQLAAELAGEGPLSLVLIDVDDLKAINDRDGHPAGDGALRNLARTALRVTRTNDGIFRIGGDEFALLLQADERSAERLVLRLQRALASGRRHTRHTISAGISSTGGRGTEAYELLRRADVALLRAKTRGKDTVVCAGDRVSAPDC
jgi:diguanylate cyclase (GGDEF)-like protein